MLSFSATLTPAAVLMLLLCSACGGSESASGSVSGAQASPAPGSPLPEVSTDNVFATASYTLGTSQSYTLTLTNDGDGLHNWHVLDTKGTDGKEIETKLIEKGKTAGVSFSIAKPGVYHFQCDVHPDTMKGTLTVR